MTLQKKLNDKRMILLLFFLCWIVYFVSYLGKRNFPAAMTELISNGFLGKAQAGFINTIFFLCYGAGQLVNGILADRFSPSRMIFLGLLLSATANLGMGLSDTPLFMPAFWAVNGYALSMLWAPILRLFSDLLEGDHKINCTVNLSSAVAVGGLSSCLLSAWMICLLGWRWAFFSASLLLYLTAVIWRLLIGRIMNSACTAAALPDNIPAVRQCKQLPLRLLIGSAGVIIISVPVMLHGTLRDGISSWIPTYITETFAIVPTLSILLTTLLPFVNLAGPYMAHFVNKNWFKNETATASFFFLAASVCLGCLFLFGKNSLPGCVFFLCLITTAIEGVNVMLVSLIPLRYSGSGRAATLSGFFNFLTYAGSALSSFGTGMIAQHSGWQAVLLMWLAFSCLGLFLCLFAKVRSYSFGEQFTPRVR